MAVLMLMFSTCVPLFWVWLLVLFWMLRNSPPWGTADGRAGEMLAVVAAIFWRACSACSVGAGAISKAAAALEDNPADAIALAGVAAAVVEAENFILKLCR